MFLLIESLFSLYPNICHYWDCCTSITFVNAAGVMRMTKHQLSSLYFSWSETQIPQMTFVILLSLSIWNTFLKIVLIPKEGKTTDHKQSIMIFWVNCILSIILYSFTLHRQVPMLSQPYFLKKKMFIFFW